MSLRITTSTLVPVMAFLVMALLSETAAAQDFGLLLGEREVSQRQRANSLNEVILKTKGGFKGELSIDVSVDPDVAGIEASIDGARDGKVSSDASNVYVDAFISRSTPPGEYRVTVTLSGMVDGRKVVRQQSYTLVVRAPPQLDLMVAPARLVIKQGEQATTTVTTLFQPGFDQYIELQAWSPAVAAGLNAQFIDGGEDTIDPMGGIPKFLVSSEMAGGDGFIDSVLEVTVDPATRPGEYVISIEGTYNPVFGGGLLSKDEPHRKHNIPLYVTVVADPKYAELQDPPNFDLYAERELLVLPPGLHYTWVGAWGHRWDSYVRLDLNMKTPGGPVAAGIQSRRPLRLPTDNQLYTRGAYVSVSESAPPGDYPALLTGSSLALNGNRLDKQLDVIIRVPEPTEKKPAEEPKSALLGSEPILAEPIPDQTEYVQNFLWPEQIMDAAIGQACGLLSEPADTISCSVHTFKKPETSKAKPKEDVEIGESVERPAIEGGGFDTEVFVRNPDDNNLRQGCGDMNEDILTSLTGMNWPPAPPGAEATRFEYLTCNVAAQKKSGKRAFIRAEDRRNYLNTDTSDARRADYKRRQDRSYVSADRGNLGEAVVGTLSDAVDDGVGLKSCPAPKKPDRMDKQVEVKLNELPEAITITVSDVMAARESKDGLESVAESAKVVADCHHRS